MGESTSPETPAPNNTPQEDVNPPDAIAQPSAPEQGISKKAQKRAAKAALLAEKKLERRAREREARKEKKRQKHEAGENGCDEGEPSQKKLKREGPVEPFSARVVVDLGFDDMMSDKEIVSLASQLAYTYSANRRAARPFSSLLFTSINGRLKVKLEKQNDACYKRWDKTEWWEEGYENLWSRQEEVAAEEDVGELTGAHRTRSYCEKDKVVYLTADAEDEVDELKEGETYIIGGIVDHNRYKNLCQKKATSSGIRTARLPIGKYIDGLTTRKVLTVNQVFEILVHWAENRDWEKAFYSVIPQRKFQQSSKPVDPA